MSQTSDKDSTRTHCSLARPAILLCDLGSGLNLSGGSLRRTAPALRFDPFRGFLTCPSLGSSRFLSYLIAEAESGPAVTEGLAVLRVPSQLHGVLMVRSAALMVLAHQDPNSNGPFLSASSDCCPSPGCVPAFHTLPLFSSPTCGLPSLWPPMPILGPPTMAFADSPSRDGHSSVQGKQACTSPPRGLKAPWSP